jgi:Na+-transporting methylmalonyl-CoA/oxaloacetate decarboxylase gamma subunit
MVHSDDRLTSAITLSLFGVGVAASLLLILAHDRPFTGELAVSSNPLLQVMPALGAS